MKRTHQITLSKVCTIAFQALQVAAKKKIQLTQSDAMRQAWQLVKTTECFIITFERQSGKSAGQQARKVVTRELTRFYEFRGATFYPNSTKTYAKPGLTAYVDMARVVATPNYPIIKIYDKSIRGIDTLAA